MLIELHIPVRTRAEGLVGAGTTTTQRHVVECGSFWQFNAFQFHATSTHIGSIRGDADLWVAAALGLFDAVDAVAERTRRALLDRVDDLLLARPLGIDEGFLPRAEDGFQRTAACVSA